MMPAWMALTVIVRSGDLSTPASITFDAPRIVIGRGEGSEVLLPDPSVSHRHASIRQRGTDYVVIDEGSTNGTFAGPVRLSPHAPRVLRSGDLLRMGRVWLEVRIEQVAVTQSVKLITREIALNLVASALSAQGEPSDAKLRVTTGPSAGAELSIGLGERRYIIGRGAGVDLSIDDPDLSRRQVEVMRRGSSLIVRDLGSKNGTLLAGQRIEGKEAPWPLGVPLTIGQSELVYEDPVAVALAELEASADERMRDDDAVDPPTGAPPPAAPKATLGEIASEISAGDAPVARVPQKVERASRRLGIGVVDVLVGLLALLVLGASLFGLWLLLKA